MASFGALTTAVRNAGGGGISKQSGPKLNAFKPGTGTTSTTPGVNKLPGGKGVKEPGAALHNPALPGFPKAPSGAVAAGAQPATATVGAYAPIGVTSIPPGGGPTATQSGTALPVPPVGGTTGTQPPAYDATYYQNVADYNAKQGLDIAAQTKQGGVDDQALQAALLTLGQNLKTASAQTEGNANQSGGLYSSGYENSLQNLVAANHSQVATDQQNNANQHDAIANRIALDNDNMTSYAHGQGQLSVARMLALNANDPSIGTTPATPSNGAASGGTLGVGTTATQGPATGLTKGVSGKGKIQATKLVAPIRGTTATKGAAKGLTKGNPVGYVAAAKGIAKSKKGNK